MNLRKNSRIQQAPTMDNTTSYTSSALRSIPSSVEFTNGRQPESYLSSQMRMGSSPPSAPIHINTQPPSPGQPPNNKNEPPKEFSHPTSSHHGQHYFLHILCASIHPFLSRIHQRTATRILPLKPNANGFLTTECTHPHQHTTPQSRP
eukprot:536776_1